MNFGNFGFAEAIAFVALIVAFYYAVQNNRLTKKLIAKEESEAKSKKRADISASFSKMGSNNYRLKIFNKGNCPARNIRLILPEEHCLLDSDIEAKFPHEVLEPYENVDLIAAPHFGSKRKYVFTFIWDDDFQRDNEKKVYPTL